MKTYRTKDLIKLGLSKSQLVHISQIGLVKPTQNPKGRGSRRLYSEYNVRQLKIIKILLDCKLPFRDIGDMLLAWDYDLQSLLLYANEFYGHFCYLKRTGYVPESEKRLPRSTCCSHYGSDF